MSIKIEKEIDVLLLNGIYYAIKDAVVRAQIEGWSKIETLDPTSEAFVPSKTIYAAIKELSDNTDNEFLRFDAKKLDKEVYNNLVNIALKRIAFTASYNDLEDVPSFGGARVEDTALVFTGESTGQEKELLEQLDLTAQVIGNGVL